MTVSTQIGSMVALLTAEPANGGAINAVGHETRAEAKAVAHRSGVHLRDLLLSARRYHLGTDVTTTAALYGFNVQDPIKNMLNGARVPFDSVWIEWPVAAQLMAVGVDPAPDVPRFAGVLIRRVRGHASRFMISHVHYSEDQGMVDMGPLSILVDTETPIDKSAFAECHALIYECLKGRVAFAVPEQPADLDIRATMEDTQLIPVEFDVQKVLNSTLIGGTLGGNLTGSGLSQLFPYATYCFTPGFYENIVKHVKDPESKWHSAMKDVMTEHIAEHSGSMRFVLGALAVLNDKQYVTRTPVKPGQKRPGELIKPKLQPSYEFVSMNAPHVVFIRQLQGQHGHSGRQHMRHEVTGTWVNYHKTGKADCDHEFANLDDTGDRKICLLCGRKKSWRAEHERGNIELGFKKRAARVVVA